MKSEVVTLKNIIISEYVDKYYPSPSSKGCLDWTKKNPFESPASTAVSAVKEVQESATPKEEGSKLGTYVFVGKPGKLFFCLVWYLIRSIKELERLKWPNFLVVSSG